MGCVCVCACVFGWVGEVLCVGLKSATTHIYECKRVCTRARVGVGLLVYKSMEDRCIVIPMKGSPFSLFYG